METVIDDLSTEHRPDFHVVRLNGFIHTDDKLALREIWRQLGREMDVDEGDTTKVRHSLEATFWYHCSELRRLDDQLRRHPFLAARSPFASVRAQRGFIIIHTRSNKNHNF